MRTTVDIASELVLLVHVFTWRCYKRETFFCEFLYLCYLLFRSRQKSQWRSRRVIINFNKEKAALDQLENKEVVPDNEGDEEGEQDKGEDEEITEEDLLDILLKLRDEYYYCLFCGFQYESVEALSSNFPGIDEDDH